MAAAKRKIRTRKKKKSGLRIKSRYRYVKRRRRGLGLALLTAGFALLGLFGVLVYHAWIDNVKAKESRYLLIPRGAEFSQVMDSLDAQDVLKNKTSFNIAAKLIGYPSAVRSGRYKIEPDMGNIRLLFNLRAGIQEPINFTFISTWTLERLAEKFSAEMDFSKEEFLATVRDPQLLDSLGFTQDNIMSVFIPNTYSLYWDTPPRKLVQRMKKEFDRFWTDERLAKAEKQNLKPEEVITLASIVQAETSQEDEKPRVAGLYLNRIRDDWPLQADPTLKFAWQDFGLRRIYHKHKEIDSPYNTYMYKGLPPGPINCPSISSIEAVLEPEEHNYFFMVARFDGSRYHTFSTADEYRKHVNAANRYASKLNKAGVK